MAKAAARDRKAQRVKQDEVARAETGIRTLRQKADLPHAERVSA